MKNNKKHTIILGVICALLSVAAILYTITFNDSRLIAPMDFREYVFRPQDLPMIISCILISLYIVYIYVLLMKARFAIKEKERIHVFWFLWLFYEGKMSHTFMDERYKENKMKAQMAANKIALTIIFVALIIIGQGRLMNIT